MATKPRRDRVPEPASDGSKATASATAANTSPLLPGQEIRIQVTQPKRTPEQLEIVLKELLILSTKHPPKFRIPDMPMPKCADFLLSLIGPLTEEKGQGFQPLPNPDEIAALFEEYFIRGFHDIFPNGHGEDDEGNILARAFRCHTVNNNDSNAIITGQNSIGCCLPCSCVTLGGNRRLLLRDVHLGKIRRLFLADLVWLYFMERMGIFSILHTLLSDFAYNGKYAFDVFDISSVILNTWVELAKMGISSQTMDRESAYERCLGWKQPTLPRKTTPPDKGGVKDNCEMNKAIHVFISLALEYFRERKAIEAIQGAVLPGSVSYAALESIRASIRNIRNASKYFEQGRNMVITLYGIVEVIATFGLLLRVRGMIPLTQSYTKLEDLVPEAIDKLGLSDKVGRSAVNTYQSHHQAASDLRDILLDLEVLHFERLDVLQVWLDLVEERIQGFRKAYLDITGIDLLKPEYRGGTFTVEQQTEYCRNKA